MSGFPGRPVQRARLHDLSMLCGAIMLPLRRRPNRWRGDERYLIGRRRQGAVSNQIIDDARGLKVPTSSTDRTLSIDSRMPEGRRLHRAFQENRSERSCCRETCRFQRGENCVCILVELPATVRRVFRDGSSMLAAGAQSGTSLCHVPNGTYSPVAARSQLY
jgi:hypothetical protein